MRALEAVPVRMSAPDAYKSLSRGTMDGLVFPMESVSSYGLDKLVKHATEGVSFGSFIVAYSINQKVWDGLPADVKQAMDEASEAIEPSVCAEVDKEQVELPPEARAVGRHLRAATAGDPRADERQAESRRQGMGRVPSTAAASRPRRRCEEFDALLAAGEAKK